MYKILSILFFEIIFFSGIKSWSNLNCPLFLELDGVHYCASLVWEFSSVKKRNVFENSRSFSPQFIRRQTPGSRWLYSNAKIKIWQAGDPLESSVHFDENFQIFSFMEMLSGHGHTETHHFYWDPKVQVYKIEQMALHQMDGCWTLRWSIQGSKKANESFLLHKIIDYEDIKGHEKLEIINYCEICKAEDSHH